MRLSGSMQFCLRYVRLVRPVFLVRCECCVTVLCWNVHFTWLEVDTSNQVQ